MAWKWVVFLQFHPFMKYLSQLIWKPKWKPFPVPFYLIAKTLFLQKNWPNNDNLLNVNSQGDFEGNFMVGERGQKTPSPIPF